MKTKAKFVKDIHVSNSNEDDVFITLFEHENGGLFAIDASYLDSIDEDKEYIKIPDPFNKGKIVQLYYE